jgi:hypothetical protein
LKGLLSWLASCEKESYHGFHAVIKKEIWRFTMRKQDKKPVYVRMKDGAGNQFLCPIDALKDLKKATDEEMEKCVDDAVVGRYAGEIKIVDK